MLDDAGDKESWQGAKHLSDLLFSYFLMNHQ